MQALIAILIGALILAALAYSIGRLITPLESRWPPLARLWGRRAALEEAERWCVGLRTHDRIGAAAYQQRMSGLARGQRTLPRGGRDG
ncbi:hypothetical protein OG616_38485 [Streptomyces antibioticus]|uniref:hypothetical protein n=1 Tax=Streptomyces antibioticus TaxID=1890 RepID=UPI00225125DE|nr:hypothetical protein [Streptomyces antibioticus]MCX5173877.1 hypothetical protein [Streptomyces antibioticus]